MLLQKCFHRRAGWNAGLPPGRVAFIAAAAEARRTRCGSAKPLGQAGRVGPVKHVAAAGRVHRVDAKGRLMASVAGVLRGRRTRQPSMPQVTTTAARRSFQATAAACGVAIGRSRPRQTPAARPGDRPARPARRAGRRAGRSRSADDRDARRPRQLLPPGSSLRSRNYRQAAPWRPAAPRPAANRARPGRAPAVVQMIVRVCRDLVDQDHRVDGPGVGRLPQVLRSMPSSADGACDEARKARHRPASRHRRSGARGGRPPPTPWRSSPPHWRSRRRTCILRVFRRILRHVQQIVHRRAAKPKHVEGLHWRSDGVAAARASRRSVSPGYWTLVVLSHQVPDHTTRRVPA